MCVQWQQVANLSYANFGFTTNVICLKNATHTLNIIGGKRTFLGFNSFSTITEIGAAPRDKVSKAIVFT